SEAIILWIEESNSERYQKLEDQILKDQTLKCNVEELLMKSALKAT
ncbi:hypothetical protein A2U01_0057874, partial [Trifolium medium]|nr:hypothetical protein [Trifolium medium]